MQCKYYINSCWGAENLGVVFWNFLEIFLEIFNPHLIEFCGCGALGYGGLTI